MAAPTRESEVHLDGSTPDQPGQPLLCPRHNAGFLLGLCAFAELQMVAAPCGSMFVSLIAGRIGGWKTA